MAKADKVYKRDGVYINKFGLHQGAKFSVLKPYKDSEGKWKNGWFWANNLESLKALIDEVLEDLKKDPTREQVEAREIMSDDPMY